MNYRHHYHAGNFADVAKHAILLALVRGLQRKDKGFLFLDTHAGRGGYDLSQEDRGDSLARQPEWPDGWGRVEQAESIPELMQNYVAAVHEFAQSTHPRDRGWVQPYPGSPALVSGCLRRQDRAVLCELHPEEAQVLAKIVPSRRSLKIETRDGYEAVRGLLPPLERRALVLIDPPYEAENEAARVAEALQEGLRRLPGGTFAIWYPLTQRAGAPGFLRLAEAAEFPPTWTAELSVAGPEAGLKMSGAGLMVINPPWQLDAELAPVMAWLGQLLAQAPGGGGTLRWLSPER